MKQLMMERSYNKRTNFFSQLNKSGLNQTQSITEISHDHSHKDLSPNNAKRDKNDKDKNGALKPDATFQNLNPSSSIGDPQE